MRWSSWSLKTERVRFEGIEREEMVKRIDGEMMDRKVLRFELVMD